MPELSREALDMLHAVTEAGIKAERLAGRAEALGLLVLAGFLREVNTICKTGVESQQRAFRDNTLVLHRPDAG